MIPQHITLRIMFILWLTPLSKLFLPVFPHFLMIICLVKHYQPSGEKHLYTPRNVQSPLLFCICFYTLDKVVLVCSSFKWMLNDVLSQAEERVWIVVQARFFKKKTFKFLLCVSDVNRFALLSVSGVLLLLKDTSSNITLRPGQSNGWEQTCVVITTSLF